jgi:hypothetical protein
MEGVQIYSGGAGDASEATESSPREIAEEAP